MELDFISSLAFILRGSKETLEFLTKAPMLLLEPFRILRNLLVFLTYLPIRYSLPITFRVFGAQKRVIGRCIIIAPPEQMRVLLEGIEHLRSIDPIMFKSLTIDHQYVFWYHPKRYLSCRDVFSIPDSYFNWGKEGVVIAFVQSVLYFTISYVNWEKNSFETSQKRVARQNEIPKRLYEWMTRHSFSPELLQQYQEFAK